MSSVCDIIPWCFAYDYINYARYIPDDYNDMIRLPNDHPEVYQYMVDGGFAALLSDRSVPFSAIEVDQTLKETVNRDKQTADGIKGFSLKGPAIQCFYLRVQLFNVST